MQQSERIVQDPVVSVGIANHANIVEDLRQQQMQPDRHDSISHDVQAALPQQSENSAFPLLPSNHTSTEASLNRIPTLDNNKKIVHFKKAYIHDVLSTVGFVFNAIADPHQKQDSPRKLQLATECMSLDVAYLILKKLGIPCQHIFSCNNNSESRKLSLVNSNPDKIYTDIHSAERTKAAYVDLYVANFPFNEKFRRKLTKKNSYDCLQKPSNLHDCVVAKQMTYINQQKPRIFVLVCSDRTVEEAYITTITGYFQSMKENGTVVYDVYFRQLNSYTHGLPQSSKAWFIVGIKKVSSQSQTSVSQPFMWPIKLDPIAIEELLQAKDEISPEQLAKQKPVPKTAAKGLEKHIISFTYNKTSGTTWVIDVEDITTPRWKDVSPGLTQSRPWGFYLLPHRRRMTLREIARLQGINIDDITRFPNQSDRSLSTLISKSVSLNTLERVLVQALKAANIEHISNHPGLVDRWLSLQAYHDMNSQYPGPKIFVGPSNDTRMHWKIIEVSPSKMKRPMIVDSGASFHMISPDILTPEEKRKIRPIEHPIRIYTVNGTVKCRECVPIYVKSLAIWIEAILYQGAPTILSMGRLVYQHRFWFKWQHPDPPIIGKGNKIIQCSEECSVP